MSRMTFKNKVQDFPAQFNITQNGDLTGIVSASSGGKVTVPTSDSYEVYGMITLGDNIYTTGKQTFEARSQNVLAQCKQRDGTFVFELVLSPGTQPQMITFRNTTTVDVQFHINKNDSPLEAVKVCDPYNQVSISTEDIYSIQAIVNGITTECVSTTDPNATLVTFDNNIDGSKGPSASLKLLQGNQAA